MKVAFINTFDHYGGATQSCRRTAYALQSKGVEVKLVCREQSKPDPLVYPVSKGWRSQLALLREYLERFRFIPREASKAQRFQFSFDDMGRDISDLPFILQADVLHLHWIHRAFLSLKNLQTLSLLGKPIVWSLHDMWAFTGGCHYAGTCTNFSEVCGNCWHLRRPTTHDISHQIWKRKTKVYPNLGITYVASSAWLAGVARTSSLLKNERVLNIPTPVEPDIFQPMNKKAIRETLGIHPEKLILLFVAMNVDEKRKGFSFVQEALQILHHQNESLSQNMELLVFGKADQDVFSKLPFKVHHLGRLHDRLDIARAYNAANVFLMPSLQDNLPNTVLESLSCGVPVVAFNTGGIPEMVDHQENGFIAASQNAQQLAHGIDWVLKDKERYERLCKNSREKIISEYSYDVVAEQYIALYEKLIAQRKK